MNIERLISFKQHEAETEKAREELAQVEKSREKIFRNFELDDEQRIAQTGEVDSNRAKIIADNNTLYNEYSVQSTAGQSQDEFASFVNIRDRLKRALSDEPFLIPAGSRIYENKPVGDSSEPRFEMYCESSYITGTKYRYELRIVEPVDQVVGTRWHMALVQYDSSVGKDGELRTIVIPEGIWEENSRVLLPPSENTLQLCKEVDQSLMYWVRKIKYAPRPDTDKYITPSGKYVTPHGTPIELVGEKDSTLMSRTRTIDFSTLDLLDAKVDELIRSWRPEELSILEKAGGGIVRLRLFAKYSDGDYREFYKELNKIPFSDKGQLRTVIQEALLSGANSVAIKCEGSYVEREYRNLSPGKSPRSHLRRMKTGVRLALHENDRQNKQATELQKKFNAREGGLGVLDNEEKNLLAQILEVDRGNLELYVTKGIIFKNGEFSPHPTDGPSGVYFYEKEEERAAL